MRTKLFPLIALIFLTISSTFAQEYDAEIDTLFLDPLNKLAPNKNSENDSIAVMTAEEVAVTASKKDARKAKKLLAEQAEVGRLTKELIENFKFRFEPYYCRYKTEYRSEGFLGAVRCYGGTFISSLAFIPLNNQQYREYQEHRGGTYGEEVMNTREYTFTDFKVENIRASTKFQDATYFEVIINQPVTIDGRTENNLKFTFVFNYKNGKMGCAIDGETRHYAKYFGYLTALR